MIDKAERIVSALNNALSDVRVVYLYDPIKFIWWFRFMFEKTNKGVFTKHLDISVTDEAFRYWSENELADKLTANYKNIVSNSTTEEKQDG